MDPHNISNNTTSTSGCWDLDMTTMGIRNQQLLLDHLHMGFFHPMEPTQSSQPILAPSNLISVGGQVGIHGGRQHGGGGGGGGGGGEVEEEEEKEEERLGAMKEMMYKIAAMQPIDIDPATIRKPKRRNVRISDDPQSVAARHRRERISERIRILQRLVPGGTKMDTASMLDEAIRYVKFLKRQVQDLQSQRRQQPPVPLQPHLAGTQLAATGDEWQLRADVLGSSSSSIGATPGLGFSFSGDGCCSQQMH